MEYAIGLLEIELKKLQTPTQENEEEDYIGAIIGIRNEADTKLALKILKEFVENSKILKF